MPRPGDQLRLQVERPAIGGRMIARHDGAVVLVAGAIPGETVEARVERVQRHTVWATTTRVLEASADRIDCAQELACGGHVLAHVSASRQLTLKGEMLSDAFRRVGKFALDAPVSVIGGTLDGYRTRARVHVRKGRAGFFDEGTHHLCGVSGSRQLSEASAGTVARLVTDLTLTWPQLDAELEWAENAAGSECIVHVTSDVDLRPLEPIGRVPGLDGLSWSSRERGARATAWGLARITDTPVVPTSAGVHITVRHQARSFFQGNRYLFQPLFANVLSRVAGRTVYDLYAGVGAFAIGAAAAGHLVVAVEGDPTPAEDLQVNAGVYDSVTCHEGAVEAFLARRPTTVVDTVIVDPPRTGLSAGAVAGILAWKPGRVVYVSCDPATLARDARHLVDGGYRWDGLVGFDLFPRTGHVEAVVTLDRATGA